MRIWRFQEHGPIENMTLEDLPVPEPSEGEALVKLHYAALNPADRFLVQGMYPGGGEAPMTVGRDGAGTVEKSNGGRFNPGDKVVVLRSATGVTRDGTLAEYVRVPEECLAPLPEGWTEQEGAAAPLVYLTAWRALVQLGKVKPGMNVLVTGATGGVGLAAVQLAKALGATVVGTSRAEAKRARLLEAGADFAVDASDAGKCEDEIKKVLGGKCHIVVENLGGPFLQSAVNVCDKGARVYVVGLLAGLTSTVVLGLLIAKQIRIEGCAVAALSPPEAQRAWAGIVTTLNQSGYRPIIDSVFPMDQCIEGFHSMAKGSFGKVLIDVTAQTN